MSCCARRWSAGRCERLRALAESRGTTLNRLIDDRATVVRAEFDAATRFKLRAARCAGRSERGLALLAQAAMPDSSNAPTPPAHYPATRPADPPTSMPTLDWLNRDAAFAGAASTGVEWFSAVACGSCTDTTKETT